MTTQGIKTSRNLGMGRYAVTGNSGTTYMVEHVDGAWIVTSDSAEFLPAPTKGWAMADIASRENRLAW
jgi:hypothetical protein